MFLFSVLLISVSTQLLYFYIVMSFHCKWYMQFFVIFTPILLLLIVFHARDHVHLMPYIIFVNKSCWYVVFNKLQTLVWGHTEIPGGECHTLGIWDTKLMSPFMCSQQNIEIGWWGCWQMHRWVSMTLMCMCNVFPTGRGKQTIMTLLKWHESSVYVEGRGI